MDESILHALNDWFAASTFRSDLARFLAIAPLVAIVGLWLIAWFADWGRRPDRRAILVIGALAALLALVINLALGHLYYRPRPYVVLSVHTLLPRAADSSLFSDHVAAAGALTAALLITRRWAGLAAAGLALLLAVGRVGAAVHYPSDVLVGVVVGAAAFAVLIPLRHVVARFVAVASAAETAVTPRKRAEQNLLFRHGPVVATGILVVTAGLAYGVRALQDHGRIEAGARAESRLQITPGARPPSEFSGTPVSTIASGSFTATHAAAAGQVTQVTRELDGDIHIRLESAGAFIVLEIIPELPMSPPRIGEDITAWGIVRHDGLHNWWELHPLIGWAPGDVTVPGSPQNGSGD